MLDARWEPPDEAPPLHLTAHLWPCPRLFLDPSRILPPQALLRLASHLVRGEYCAAPPALRLNGLLSLFERAARYSRDIAEI